MASFQWDDFRRDDYLPLDESPRQVEPPEFFIQTELVGPTR